MTAGDAVPSLSVGTISSRAAATAATLLEAYDAQDRRQLHVKEGNLPTARRQAERARTRMGETWTTEFPGVAEAHARAAGELFMDALFLQDEIENWEAIPSTEGDLDSVLLTRDPGRPGGPSATDDRWEDVQSLLDAAAVEVGIPGPFASKQTRFWLLHGQRSGHWEAAAGEAFVCKLRAMFPEADEAARETLADYFVEGVKLHDRWSLDEGTASRTESRDLVGRFYERVFELRGGANAEGDGSGADADVAGGGEAGGGEADGGEGSRR
jgi:hypothetical protein